MRRGELVRRFFSVALVGAMAVALAACGGSSNDQGTGPKCGKALDSYHAALVASDTDGSGPNLTDADEQSHQQDVVENCSQSGFEAFISGPGYDYSKGADAIALGDPSDVYRAFCTGASKPNDC